MAAATVVATSAAMRVAATTMTVTSTTVAVTSAAMTAAAAVANKLYHPRCVIAFFVKDVKGRQANICNFFLPEEDLIAISVA
jgi:hypothetical protein